MANRAHLSWGHMTWGWESPRSSGLWCKKEHHGVTGPHSWELPLTCHVHSIPLPDALQQSDPLKLNWIPSLLQFKQTWKPLGQRLSPPVSSRTYVCKTHLMLLFLALAALSSPLVLRSMSGSLASQQPILLSFSLYRWFICSTDIYGALVMCWDQKLRD